MFSKDNFSETHLLFSEPVKITLYEDESRSILLGCCFIHLPTVRDVNFDEDLMFLLSILNKTIKELKDELSLGLDFHSHLELFSALAAVQSHIPVIAGFMYRVREGFKIICPDISLIETVTICDRPMTDELFERIRDMVLVSAGIKSHANNYKYMSPEQRAMEEKIQAIKNKGKKQDNTPQSFEKTYMVLTYEFGYTREEILNMTMYAVKTILKYTSKSINYKLTLMAKAYGNTKKVKFITDKGD
jgi:hypothetical protein